MTDLLSQSKEYLAFIRTKDCLVCGKPGEPDHLEEIGMGNNRKKSSYRHFSAVPLCRRHHDQRHQLNLTEFYQNYNDHSLVLYREALSLFIEFLTGISTPFHNDRRV